MKNWFKFDLFCNLCSKESSLVSKLLGCANNNNWKAIVHLQKVNFKPKKNKNVCLISEWGRNMVYFIDKLVSEWLYYTPYRFVSNFTPEEEQLLNYYITTQEIFKVFNIRYLYLINNTIISMLEK